APGRADVGIGGSEERGEPLRRRGVADDGLACIPPAPRPAEAGGRPRAPGARGLVCYAGNLDGYQNLDFLLHSFARVRAEVPAARLVLVTHAAPDRRCPGPREGVEVVRAGSYDEVRSLLETAEVAVCPRVERSGFPMKLLNYMAAGKAIVVSAGSAKGLRDGVNARIVADGDERGFARAIVELLEAVSARAL